MKAGRLPRGRGDSGRQCRRSLAGIGTGSVAGPRDRGSGGGGNQGLYSDTALIAAWPVRVQPSPSSSIGGSSVKTRSPVMTWVARRSCSASSHQGAPPTQPDGAERLFSSRTGASNVVRSALDRTRKPDLKGRLDVPRQLRRQGISDELRHRPWRVASGQGLRAAARSGCPGSSRFRA